MMQSVSALVETLERAMLTFL